jgi:hypothetical protein
MPVIIHNIYRSATFHIAEDVQLTVQLRTLNPYCNIVSKPQHKEIYREYAKYNSERLQNKRSRLEKTSDTSNPRLAKYHWSMWYVMVVCVEVSEREVKLSP